MKPSEFTRFIIIVEDFLRFYNISLDSLNPANVGSHAATSQRGVHQPPTIRPRPALSHGPVDGLILSQLLLEPIVRLDTEPPLLDMVERGLEVDAVGLHDVGDDQGPGPRHPVVAVDQHLAPRPKTRVYEVLNLFHFRNNRLQTTVSQSYHKILQPPLKIGPEKIRNK